MTNSLTPTILALGIAALAHGLSAQKAMDPQPVGAIEGILAAFHDHPIVALGMQHQFQDEADFSLTLIRNPRFAAIVNDIVVECGNPLYQDVLDRYIAGEAVPIEQLQLVWRNTTQPGRCDPRQHLELLDAVRQVNKTLPGAERLRVLAGDSPIDWSKVNRPADLQPFLNRRDSSFASVVIHEALAKHRKALLVIGAAHVLRHPITWRAEPNPGAATASMLIDRVYPHSVFVIIPHDGFGSRLAEFEARFAAWPRPSIVALRGNWLGAVTGKTIFGDNVRRVGGDPAVYDDPYFGFSLEDLADDYLYLGPLASLKRVEWPDFSGTPYGKEIERRNALMGMAAVPVPAPRRAPPSS